MSPPVGIININLSAVQQNWLMMARALSDGAECGAVVKADAYGLGAAPVVQALFSVGCKVFFVAHVEEAVALRRILPVHVALYVLQGVREGDEPLFVRHNLIPVLISSSMFWRWHDYVRANSGAKSAIKVNTGMNRLGLSPDDLKSLCERPEAMREAGVQMLMSHLACADDPSHALNQSQLQCFVRAAQSVKQVVPGVCLSLSNSAGVLLGAAWHFSVVRPGIALYGGCPLPPSSGEAFLPAPVVSVYAKVLQVRALGEGESVGYGAEYCAARPMVVAVVSVGYADGFFRSLAGQMHAWFNGPLPLLGRVSMDSMVFDITALSGEQRPVEGGSIELLGEYITIDQMAQWANTSSYEVLTSLGGRLQKKYVEGSV